VIHDQETALLVIARCGASTGEGDKVRPLTLEYPELTEKLQHGLSTKGTAC
jgi:hypothetical protein